MPDAWSEFGAVWTCISSREWRSWRRWNPSSTFLAIYSCSSALLLMYVFFLAFWSTQICERRGSSWRFLIEAMDSRRVQFPFCGQPWIETNFHQYLSVRLPHSILAELQDLVSKMESPRFIQGCVIPDCKSCTSVPSQRYRWHGAIRLYRILVPQTFKNLHSYLFKP